MKQLTEDFVSFEIAQLLKEKGFDYKCYGLFFENKKLDISLGQYSNSELEKHDIKGMISAPTHQTALKWLREEKEIIIIILHGCNAPIDNGWCFAIQQKGNYLSESTYTSYEEAVEAACLWVLKNLL